jgi:hypothetical protein
MSLCCFLIVLLHISLPLSLPTFSVRRQRCGPRRRLRRRAAQRPHRPCWRWPGLPALCHVPGLRRSLRRRRRRLRRPRPGPRRHPPGVCRSGRRASACGRRRDCPALNEIPLPQATLAGPCWPRLGDSCLACAGPAVCAPACLLQLPATGGLPVNLLLTLRGAETSPRRTAASARARNYRPTAGNSNLKAAAGRFQSLQPPRRHGGIQQRCRSVRRPRSADCRQLKLESLSKENFNRCTLMLNGGRPRSAAAAAPSLCSVRVRRGGAGTRRC